MANTIERGHLLAEIPTIMGDFRPNLARAIESYLIELQSIRPFLTFDAWRSDTDQLIHTLEFHGIPRRAAQLLIKQVMAEKSRPIGFGWSIPYGEDLTDLCSISLSGI